ncbi:hypothetical protein D3C72_745140 [compost metagenome]
MNRLLQPFSHLLKQKVPNHMSLRIINYLEPVQIQEEHCQHFTLCLIQDMVQMFSELITVGQLGEGIIIGHELNHLLRFLAD